MSKRNAKKKTANDSHDYDKPSLFSTFKSIVNASKRGVKRQREEDKEEARPAKKANHTSKEHEESDDKNSGARKKTKKELRIEVTQTVGPTPRSFVCTRSHAP